MDALRWRSVLRQSVSGVTRILIGLDPIAVLPALLACRFLSRFDKTAFSSISSFSGEITAPAPALLLGCCGRNVFYRRMP
ncbi:MULTISPECIES: hypothetical protein [unclassified Mesorhizobium]|uniref:hypothetical protein n=1 Tax=unclassified Mesorhizobium TaxID=325217 RepID=UPI003338E797